MKRRKGEDVKREKGRGGEEVMKKWRNEGKKPGGSKAESSKRGELIKWLND